MPIIVYRCDTNSEHEHETLALSQRQATQLPRRTRCKQCNSRATRVEFAQTGAPNFRGDGWTAKGNR